MRAEAVTTAHRFAHAQSWWIASQLVTRNPELRLHQQVDLIDGEALVLELPEYPTIPLEVRQRMRILFDAKGVTLIAPVVFEILSWPEVFSTGTPSEVVERVERSLGLSPHPPERHEVPLAALAHALLAVLLATRVNDGHEWYVRSIAPVTLGVDGWGPSNLSAFPELERWMMEEFELAVARNVEPTLTPAWVVYRGLVPVVALDEVGGLHVHGQRFALDQLYVNSGCNIDGVGLQLAMNLVG